MKFNPNKCKVLTITNKMEIIRFDYPIHNKCLEKVNHAKYLGVHIDKKNFCGNTMSLAWLPRLIIANIFLQWNLVICDLETRFQCYKTLACPIVEYASSVRDPVGNKQLQYQLEQVQ